MLIRTCTTLRRRLQPISATRARLNSKWVCSGSTSTPTPQIAWSQAVPHKPLPAIKNHFTPQITSTELTTMLRESMRHTRLTTQDISPPVTSTRLVSVLTLSKINTSALLRMLISTVLILFRKTHGTTTALLLQEPSVWVEIRLFGQLLAALSPSNTTFIWPTSTGGPGPILIM